MLLVGKVWDFEYNVHLDCKHKIRIRLAVELHPSYIVIYVMNCDARYSPDSTTTTTFIGMR